MLLTVTKGVGEVEEGANGGIKAEKLAASFKMKKKTRPLLRGFQYFV